MSTSRLYYDPDRPLGFSTLTKVAETVGNNKKSDVSGYLQKQVSYTLHRPVRMRCARNPYT